MLGVNAAQAVVSIQIGYCASDIISKCGVGILIYQITYAKSSKEAMLPCWGAVCGSLFLRPLCEFFSLALARMIFHMWSHAKRACCLSEALLQFCRWRASTCAALVSSRHVWFYGSIWKDFGCYDLLVAVFFSACPDVWTGCCSRVTRLNAAVGALSCKMVSSNCYFQQLWFL